MGAGNISAQVNLDIDFTRREISQEIIDPKTSAPVSEQSSLNITAKKDAIGVPGAIANEPPQEATVTQEQNQAGVATNNARTTEDQFETKSSTELKNYENSKTYETVKNTSNVIRRIDAALLVRDRKVINPETEEVTYEPLSPEVIEQVQNLVKSAIGIQDARGDTLMITSHTFVENFEGFEIKWYETPWFRSTV